MGEDKKGDSNMGSIVIFIDGGYLEKVIIEEFERVHIDYKLFSGEIAKIVSPDSELLRTYYYNCLPYKNDPPTNEESLRFGKRQRFYYALERIPRFEVKLGWLDKRGTNDFVQKMVDTLLSIDLVYLSSKGKITHAAIIAGDGDFVPAIKVAKTEGISIWLFHGESKHSHLWQIADERRRIDDDLIEKTRLIQNAE